MKTDVIWPKWFHQAHHVSATMLSWLTSFDCTFDYFNFEIRSCQLRLSPCLVYVVSKTLGCLFHDMKMQFHILCYTFCLSICRSAPSDFSTCLNVYSHNRQPFSTGEKKKKKKIEPVAEPKPELLRWRNAMTSTATYTFLSKWNIFNLYF